MTLDKTNTIDWLGIERSTGYARLTVVDDWDWTSERVHVVQLQDKLNTYLAFVESGEVYARIEEEIGRAVSRDSPVVIAILGKHKMTPYGERFLEHATNAFRQAGHILLYRLVLPAEDDGSDYGA